MRNNRNKHKILKSLFEFRDNKTKLNKINPLNELGLLKSELLYSNGIKDFIFENCIPELIKNNEIVLTEKENNTIYVINKENGITSFVDKKYISRNRKNLIKNFKDWTSIIVPVITTIISLYLVIIQNKSNKEIEELKQSVKKQESTIKRLELLNNNKVFSDKK
jgi:hypothetical protein